MGDGMTRKETAGQINDAVDDALLDRAQDIRFATVLSLLGFASFWAVVVFVFAGNVFEPASASEAQSLGLRFALLLGFTAIQFASYTRLVDWLAYAGPRLGLRIATTVAMLAFAAIGVCAAFGASVPFVVAAAIWFVLGVACGLFAGSWGTVWSMIDSGRPDSRASSLAIAGSLVLAVSVSALLLFVPAIVSIIVIACLMVVSVWLQAYCSDQFPEPEKIDWKTSMGRLKLLSRNLLTPGFAGLSFGVSVAFGMFLFGQPISFAVCLAGIGSGSLAALAIVAARRTMPRVSSIERVVFPLFGGCLLLFPFCGGLMQIVLLALLVATISCYLVFHWCILMALSYRHHVQTAFHYAQGLIAPAGGIAIGWGCTCIVVLPSAMPLADSVRIVALVVVFLLIVDLAIVPYASNKTVESMFDDGVAAGDAEAGKAATWRIRCEAVCSEHGLTPREQEVFALLARGRNAEHIGKELFISNHTVKTHTSRIYRKLAINSQQELIDLVEAHRMG